MKKVFSLFAALLFAAFSMAQTTLKNDPPHSRMQFTVVHLGFNDITGNFEKIDMTVKNFNKNITGAVYTFTADVNSIDTQVEMRDTHLKSEEFFDAKKFPEISFTSTSVVAGKTKGEYTLNGNLTMHGVTKPVKMTLVYRGEKENPMDKKMTYSMQVTGTVKRSDFGIGPKYGDAMISDVVRIKGDFELLAAK